tara:strand:- start:1024 stop:1470 length:447 start_codon:yes stop_codon:yes gene_type:complete
MRNLFIFFLPFIGFSQDYSESVAFLNTVRTYYDLPKLTVNKELSAKAQTRAEQFARVDAFIHDWDDEHGETMYRIPQDMVEKGRNYVLDASIGWTLKKAHVKNQLFCKECEEVGFGYAESDKWYYVVAKYDKMYDYRHFKETDNDVKN